MKSMSTKKFQDTLSLYLDDQLDEKSKTSFEEYLASNPDVRSEVQAWKKLREVLRSNAGFPANEWFWQKFSVRLEQQKHAHESVFPFSREFMPVAASLAVVIAGLVGILLFEQRSSLTKYFFEKKEYVGQLYQKNILEGKLFPLFTNLDKDQVLQFALFGTLPLDAQAKTALRVDENKKDGARIEFAENETRRHPPVTVEQFYREIEATPAQHITVDSILSSARDRIQESVFLGDNKSVAVHADLAKFNRTMISHIAASLESQQRKRFQRFLVASRSPYTFVIPPTPPADAPTAGAQPPQAPAMEQFVVITPDSCTIARVRINVGEIQRRVGLTSQEVRSIDERTHALMREFVAHRRSERTRNPLLSVFSDSDYFSIKVQNDVLDQSHDAMPFEVVARAPQAIRFRYELRQMPSGPKFFEEDSGPPMQMFPGEAPLPRGGFEPGHAQNRRGLDLDSVISAPRDRKPQSRTPQGKKRHTNPFEL
jgi:hypothetical protein